MARKFVRLRISILTFQMLCAVKDSENLPTKLESCSTTSFWCFIQMMPVLFYHISSEIYLLPYELIIFESKVNNFPIDVF